MTTLTRDQRKAALAWVEAAEADEYYFQKLSTGSMKMLQYSKGALKQAADAVDTGMEACTRLLVTKVHARAAGLALDMARQSDAKERRIERMRQRLAQTQGK
jgi:hypothetical protein